MPIAVNILLSYAVTIIAETIAALCWKVRKLRDLAFILLINTLTNIPFNVISYPVKIYFGRTALRIYEICAEIIIFLIEALLFKKLLSDCRRPLLFSVTLNGASLLAGIVISVLL